MSSSCLAALATASGPDPAWRRACVELPLRSARPSHAASTMHFRSTSTFASAATRVGAFAAAVALGTGDLKASCRRGSRCTAVTQRALRAAAATRRMLPLLAITATTVTCLAPGAAALEAAAKPGSYRVIEIMSDVLQRLSAFLATAFGAYAKTGWVGYLFHYVAFTVWLSLALPTTAVELATAYVFGPTRGFLCSITCKTLGQCVAFLVVLTLRQRRGWKIPDALRPRLESIRRKPLLTMISVRLTPLPLGLKNYGLAICDVPFVLYMLAGIAVNAPFSVLWALTGSSCKSLSDAIHFKGDAGGPIDMLRYAIPIVALVIFCWVKISQRRR
eukprot:TRINITY_DN62250_c0_g1_i1.p1 TRINITY_DN62250_c0_g1~~TRINITY_DN62250_c0_g1_i1.p1  ORF type:complete len:343 (-),score=48.99 TRINITY_DN62250_c0_g1_i1:41-1036(-)